MTKKAVVSVGADGRETGRWESTLECQRQGLARTWVWKSITTGSLYHGMRWVWAEDYDRLAAEGRTGELAFDLPERRRVEIRRRVVFCHDWRGRDENQLVFLFKGATRGMLRRLFTFLCGDGRGLADGFDIRETTDVVPLWRHCYRRLEVWVEGFHADFASVDDCGVLIESRLRCMDGIGEVCRCGVDEWLNLTGRVGQKNNRKEKNMPKIYVRVPGYVAGFWRGRNDDRQLTEFDPYEFNDYDDLYLFLEHHLRFIPEQNQNIFCLSERAWNHILHGKAPGGGRTILNRNPSEWPKMSEICALTGKFVTDKQESADYLCIAIPQEVLDGGRLHRTNGSFALPKKEADKFIGYLKQEFKREFETFFEIDQQVCAVNGINRSDVDRMERFLANYNMPISVESKDRESLRKLMFRMRKRKNVQPYLRQPLDPFVEHISKEDMEKAERHEKKMERIKKKAQK